MRSLVRWSTLVACLMLLQVSAITAATPQAVQVQVRLQDAVGNPVPDGLHGLILTGWDDSTGGILLWTQNQMVTTQQGLTQCFIETPAASAMLAHSGQQYIQVQVAGEAPLSPRIRLGSVPSALLTTRMDGDISTLPGEIVVRPPGAGDPDFDLLRITATDSTGKIAINHGDPDFDLLRITGSPAGSSMTLNGSGDPDFDLLRVSAAATTGSITVGSGDPDFDLLRITGSPAASSLVLNPGSGDPDFDLLRIVADSTGGSIAIEEEGVQVVKIHGGGGGGGGGSIAVNEEGTHNVSVTMSADSTGGSIAIDEEGVQVVKIQSGGGGGGGGGSIAVNEEGTHNIAISADSTDGDIAIDEEGVQRVLIHSDSAAAGISIDEPGVHLSIDCREITTGADWDYRIGNDLDGDGTPGEAGIAIDHEGVQVVRMQTGTSSSSGGGGGGEIAIGEEGVQIVRCEADSASSRIIAGKGNGDGDMITSCDASGARTRYLTSTTCGASQTSFGSDGMTMQCTPGGSTTPDTAAHLDPDGNMAMVGDLSVGGDICAVGTIGACSDARYKTDVEALQGALAQLSKIRGVNFNWRTDEFPDKGFRTDRDLGFIAQELKEVVPQVVTLGKDGYYSVDYSRLTPLLVEAVKELEARVSLIEAARQAEVSALTERLARLEEQFAKLASETATTASNLTLVDAK